MKLAPIHRAAIALLAVVACLLVAAPAAAQDDDARADALTHEAERVAATATSWAKAAHMHREAAMLRNPSDMRSYVSYLHAARLFYHAGELRDSEAMFEAAGDRARHAGDAYNAAMAYFNGAIVAEENGRAREAQALGWKGEKLARSNRLNADQRSDLARRYRVTEARGKRY